MSKPQKKTEPLLSFQRFEELTKRLLAVPRKELQEKLVSFKKRKRTKKV